MTREEAATRQKVLSVAVWLYAVYVALHYTVLLVVGPLRLHSWLGDTWYNRVIPVGGIGVLLLALFALVFWAAPYALVVLASTKLGRLTRLPRAATIVLAHTAGMVTLVGLHVVPLDGWPGSAGPILLGHDTEYAATYSTASFRAVQVGMNEEEVSRLLGPPLRQFPTGGGSRQVWAWTRSPHSSDYRMRMLAFEHGRVVERHAEFYLD